jgi:hypothetical protein
MTLRITLTSAATFSGGFGVPGLIDRDVERDDDGFPYLRGRALKGLLAEAAENVVFALALQGKPAWRAEKEILFGRPGRGRAAGDPAAPEQGILLFGDAVLPLALRQALRQARKAESARFSPAAVLNSLTDVRRQTAINPDGGPDQSTLRATRVLLPGVILEAPLTFSRRPSERQRALLAAAVLDWRRAGTARNRGRGQLRAELDDGPTMADLSRLFKEETAS